MPSSYWSWEGNGGGGGGDTKKNKAGPVPSRRAQLGENKCVKKLTSGQD